MPEAISDISKQRIATLYPGLRPLAFKILQDCYTIFGKAMNLTEAMRSMDAQYSIYMQGRSFVDGQWVVIEPGKIVTNARPGLSYHNYGLAFDCAFAGSDPYLQKESAKDQEEMWQKYGDIVKAYGMGWGGDFRLKNGAKDKPHAELAYGLQIHECLELFSQGGIKMLWSNLDQIRGVEIGQDWSS